MSTHPDPRSFDPASAPQVAGASPSETLPAVQEPPPHTPPNTPALAQHNGWTPARQAAFLRELSATHNVAAAARAVGMSRQSAYQLRARLRGEPFDAAWEAAFVTRFDVLAEAALDRALNGVEVPHYYNGELVGTSRIYDERLTLSLLSMRRHLARAEPNDYQPASAFAADDLAGLIDRVEHGPEEWHDSADEEWDLRFGPEQDEDMDEENTDAGGPPSDGTAEEIDN